MSTLQQQSDALRWQFRLFSSLVSIQHIFCDYLHSFADQITKNVTVDSDSSRIDQHQLILYSALERMPSITMVVCLGAFSIALIGNVESTLFGMIVIITNCVSRRQVRLI